ncbi:DUF3168 domain-containing protein [Aromatoleum aromaticum]|uniref:DUF3168 domain-containing protein n=1 Tax=Aromatoleum aromaticum (strain DSM 19018 / LMG 30748 / EbN1) TaxID=76114 RepID=Q5P0C1_AROAE|nr:DUF3168 domain-containing protein [Aromatoleum aromaticum]NMG53904.1 DUF3168 domain-containing protein [Aromatoleum aromaticum]CAI09243.1 hypothetical protein, possibly phage-related [Aromatoleum aromaticum EbN1]
MSLFALVKASPACTALLGANPVRLFEFGTAPELQTLPYATYQELYVRPANVLEGAPSTDHVKYQIDLWSTTATEARALGKAIRRAIDSVGIVTFFQNTFDHEARLYRITLHYHQLERIEP